MRLLCFTVASWFRYLSGTDDQGRSMPMIDPMADKLRERALAGGKDPHSLLAMREVFSEEVANAKPFVEEVSGALRSFYDEGTRATLAKYAQTYS